MMISMAPPMDINLLVSCFSFMQFDSFSTVSVPSILSIYINARSLREQDYRKQLFYIFIVVFVISVQIEIKQQKKNNYLCLRFR
jgi:hypothetical protein